MKVTEHQKSEINFFRLRPALLTDSRDGSRVRDGIYKAIKSAMDFVSKESGKEVCLKLNNNTVNIRVYGTGISDQNELSRIVFGPGMSGRMDSREYVQHHRAYFYNAFPPYFINIISEEFTFVSYSEGKSTSIYCAKGMLVKEYEKPTQEMDGLEITFTLDREIFKEYSFNKAYVIHAIKYTVARHNGLRVTFEGIDFHYEDGLLGLLKDEVGTNALYEPIHLCDGDLEFAFTHIEKPVTEIISFCNTVHTWDGGSHVEALKEVLPGFMNRFITETKLHPMNGLICYFGINLLDMKFGNAGDIVYAGHMWEYDSDGNEVNGPKLIDKIEDFLEKGYRR